MRRSESPSAPTFRDLSCDSLEVRLAYSLLLGHAEARELRSWTSNGDEMVTCGLRSGLSDLVCLVHLPAEPGSAPGSILTCRSSVMRVVHYTDEGIFNQVVSGEEIGGDSLRYLLAARRVLRALDQDPVLVADLDELARLSWGIEQIG